MSEPKATVFIPTYNGEPYLTAIFESLLKQKTDFLFDILVIDSGSKDATLDIVKKYQQVDDRITLKEIPNTEYGHGKTRNYAAQIARGEIVVYLSHDAIPAHENWLYEMVRPFEINDKIVGVMGKQIPRAHCIPMLKSEIRSVFAGFGPDFGTTLFYKDYFVNSQGVYDAVCFYSDANSAARRAFLNGELPYKDVRYAEDQLFGRDVIDAGYYKAYAPRGAVVHSNDLTFKEYRHRMFDETLGLRKIGLPVATPSRKTIAKLLVRGIVRDVFNIARDGDYSLRRKLYWLVVNPFFHIEKWRGVRMGALVSLDDQSVADKYSLENRRKQSN